MKKKKKKVLLIYTDTEIEGVYAFRTNDGRVIHDKKGSNEPIPLTINKDGKWYEFRSEQHIKPVGFAVLPISVSKVERISLHRKVYNNVVKVETKNETYYFKSI